MNTLFVITESAGLTGFTFLINAYYGNKHDTGKYLLCFLLSCGVLFSYSAQASYYEDYSAGYTYDWDMLTDAEKKLCADSMLKCERNAKYHYELSKTKCWWLPDMEERTKARHCFLGAITTIAPGTPQSKIVAAVLYFLGVYGLACLDEWNYINDHLLQSKAWWESYEFYRENLESNR